MENNIGHPWIHLHTFGLGPQTKSELSIPLTDCGASGLKLIQLNYWSPCFKDFSLEFYVARIKEEELYRATVHIFMSCTSHMILFRSEVRDYYFQEVQWLDRGLTKLVTGGFWTHLGWHWQFLLFFPEVHIHSVHQLFPDTLGLTNQFSTCFHVSGTWIFSVVNHKLAVVYSEDRGWGARRQSLMAICVSELWATLLR